MTEAKVVSGPAAPLAGSDTHLLDRAFPGEPLWPVLIDSTWKPRVIPNPLPEMNLGVWDALVDVVLDVCWWVIRRVIR